MAKDPAFLFYYQDFAYGTRKMTFEEKGCYIELLCEQADTGHLSLDDVKRILKNSFPIWERICSKFITDKDGLYFNEILDEHLEKRRKFTESRKKNLKGIHKASHMNPHMENVNVNENINGINKEEWTIQKLWIKTFGKNPNLPEAEETQKIVDKFGYEKTYLIMKQATLDGFKKIKTLANSLDDNGNIKPRTIAGERPPQPIKEKYCFCGKEAVMWIDGIGGCSFEHCLEGKKLKKGELK